jgi:hypothetical protein
MLLLCLMVPTLVCGYEPQVHQRLTFYAAKVLNRCLDGSDVPPLTPLQVRFIATSNMGLANSNALVRFFRWSYFDVADRDDRKLLWLINTRFLNHFEEVTGYARTTRDDTERYRELGRIVSYVQLVSSPSRAVPVYTARWWRWSFGDRFDDYPVSEQSLEAALGQDCSFLAEEPESYRAVLYAVAYDTLKAVRSPIGGLPTTWESFWQPGRRPGDFGDYGPAGNSFGRKVEFPCSPDGGEQCLLLDNDPLYVEFALARQLSAIRGTARAMYLHQLLHAEPLLPDSVADHR